MNYLHSLLFFAFALPLLSPGAELTIAAAGKSDYQIVIADSAPDDAIGIFNKQAAGTVAQIIKVRTGAVLPVLEESKMLPEKPSIYIGSVKKLAQTGQLQLWEHAIEVKGKDVFLYGSDAWLPNKNYPDSKRHTDCILGSFKAALVFLEKFADAVFTGSPDLASSVVEQGAVTVPTDYHYRKIPQILYVRGGAQGPVYDLSNNFFPSPWYGCHGGHSHNLAIPVAQYYQSNPEFFALIKGKRLKAPQYCLSNPQVRELIYRELLASADKGFKMVQLGQSDGFRFCECDACKSLYNVEKPGEKLWIMHRDMALRFQKDRPGVKVCIMCYGPTAKPPETFRDFPDNVMIELCSYRI